MAIYRLDIPLENYEGDDTYKQKLYIESSFCPTKKQVLSVLQMLHERDSNFQGYLGTWKSAIELIEPINDFPYLDGPHMVLTNIFVDTKFGKRPLTMSIPEILYIP